MLDTDTENYSVSERIICQVSFLYIGICLIAMTFILAVLYWIVIYPLATLAIWVTGKSQNMSNEVDTNPRVGCQ